MNHSSTSRLLAALATAALVTSSQAATILSLGVDTTTDADWRTTSTTKTSAFDPNGDNIYGSDGYFVGYSAVGASNTTIELSLSVKPSYISSITSFSPFFASNGYANIDNPQAAGEINGALYYTAGTKFSFTVSQNTDFLLGVIVGDGISDGVSSITINQTVGGSATATNAGFSTVDGVVEYVFFSISAQSGDEFDVVTAVANGNQGITGLTFEAIPEPSAILVGSLGGLLLLRRRRG